MIIQLQLEDVLSAHEQTILETGGSGGVRDLGGIESAIAQPQMTFDGIDLYPSLPEKAAAIAFSLINNHPFVDGNKRIGYVAMRLFLRLNGYDIAQAGVDEKERIILSVASGQMGREEFAAWVMGHARTRAAAGDVP